ncbi:hypothetical protein CEXT_461181 [Caerostris extrusa]|uniref:Uncharacterized protein n=1 Tax=Caerostris extrusa TaxID=172846 RepID=A0AAV4QP59_CAEEX|nr:hypothetical protein CEXT_461181 [Caerostris extrusa]
MLKGVRGSLELLAHHPIEKRLELIRNRYLAGGLSLHSSVAGTTKWKLETVYKQPRSPDMTLGLAWLAKAEGIKPQYLDGSIDGTLGAGSGSHGAKGWHRLSLKGRGECSH